MKIFKMARRTIFMLCLWLAFTSAKQRFSSDYSRCRYESKAGVIDLNPLANDNDTPRFKDVEDPSQTSTFGYSWNPCRAFNEQSCQGVEVCQIDMISGTDYVLGRPGQSSFVEESDNLFLRYRTVSTVDGQQRVTDIQLICDKSVEGTLVFNEENPPLTYKMTLTSRFACPTTLTTPGSVPIPTGAPGPAPGPSPDIYNIKTITILLGCILLSVILLMFLVFLGLITRQR